MTRKLGDPISEEAPKTSHLAVMPRNSFWKEKRKTEMLSTPARKIQGKAKTTKTLVKHTSKLSPCGKREAMSGTRYLQSVFSTTYPQGVPPSFPGSGFYLQNPTLSNSPQRTYTAQITPYPSMCPELFKLIILILIHKLRTSPRKRLSASHWPLVGHIDHLWDSPCTW